MTDFVCHVKEQLPEGTTEEIREVWREACKGLDFYGEYGGHQYCVLHFPSCDKEEDLKQVLDSKLTQRDYNFGGTFFPAGTSDFEAYEFNAEVNFAGATFAKGANFAGARFNGVETCFRVATFNGEQTNFSSAQFNGENTWFSTAQFNSEVTSFSGATFNGEQTSFVGATFSGDVPPERRRTTFYGATFNSNANFVGAKFDDSWTLLSDVTFNGCASFSRVVFNSEATDFGSAKFGGENTSFYEAEFNYGVAFTGANFGSKDVSFLKAKFNGEYTWFFEAAFSGKVSYSEAEFGSEQTLFTWAEFDGSDTKFLGARFNGKETRFDNARFSSERTYFDNAEFGSARTSFKETTFAKEVNFRETTFREQVGFWGMKNRTVFGTVFGREASVRFDYSRIEKPELFTFDSLVLRPNWFVNVDVRKVNFTNVSWYGLPGGPRGKFEDEIAALEEREVDSPYKLLSQACQRLSVNAEENHEYPLANEFHYWLMQAQRRENPGSGFAPWRLIWWYWALSGYGERLTRAAAWLIGILIGFALLYMLVGPVGVQRGSLGSVVMAAWASIMYSLGVMTRVANDIPNSASVWVKSFIILEGVVGPFQIALCALALRRRFMR